MYHRQKHRFVTIATCLCILNSFPRLFSFHLSPFPHEMWVDDARKRDKERGVEATGISHETSLLRSCHFKVTSIKFDVWHSCIICPLFCYILSLYFMISVRWAYSNSVHDNLYIYFQFKSQCGMMWQECTDVIHCYFLLNTHTCWYTVYIHISFT